MKKIQVAVTVREGRICEVFLTKETSDKLKKDLLALSDEELFGVYQINLPSDKVGEDFEKLLSGLMQISEALDKPEIEDLLAKFFEAGLRAGLAQGVGRVRKLPEINS